MAIVCPECAFSSVPGARFCGGCGVDLAPALRHAGEPERAADAVVKAELAVANDFYDLLLHKVQGYAKEDAAMTDEG